MESKSIEYKQKRESLIIDFAGNHFLNQFVPTMKVQNMYDNAVTLCHKVDTWSKYKQIPHYFVVLLNLNMSFVVHKVHRSIGRALSIVYV